MNRMAQFTCDFCLEETNFLVAVQNPPQSKICLFCLKQILERIDTSKRPEYPMTKKEKDYGNDLPEAL